MLAKQKRGDENKTHHGDVEVILVGAGLLAKDLGELGPRLLRAVALDGRVVEDATAGVLALRREEAVVRKLARALATGRLGIFS